MSSLFEDARIMPMSSLSSLDLAKARSTRRTRLLTLSGWFKPKIGRSLECGRGVMSDQPSGKVSAQKPA